MGTLNFEMVSSKLSWPSVPSAAAAHLPVLALPSVAGAMVLPTLAAAALAANGSDDLRPLLSFLLCKRAILYAGAIGAAYVAAMRSSDAAGGLGERLEQITIEGVLPASLPQQTSVEMREVARALDSTSGATQAAALPLLLGVLLLSAYAVTALVGAPPTATDEASAAADALRALSCTVQPLSNSAVCAFCCNAELQATARALGLARVDEPSPSVATYPGQVVAAAMAAALVGAAYLLPASEAWPAQNLVNACIAVSVARVLQIPSLGAVVAALVGLAAYDALGTLTSIASAAEPTVQAATSTLAAAAAESVPSASASSVREGVAQSRLAYASGAASWQPGLLVVLVRGRVTDGLGLGDVVCPAMLLGWARRYDLAAAAQRQAANEGGGKGDEGGEGGYLGAALGGYTLGCLLLEIAPPELARAALLFLVPSALAALLARLAVKRELARAFGLDPGAST